MAVKPEGTIRRHKRSGRASIMRNGEWVDMGAYEALQKGDINAALHQWPRLAGIGRAQHEMTANLSKNIEGMTGYGIPGAGTTPYAEQRWEDFRETHPYSAEQGRFLGRMAPSLAASPASLTGQTVSALGTSLLEEKPEQAAAWNLLGLGTGRYIGGRQKATRDALSGGALPDQPISPNAVRADEMNVLRGKGARFIKSAAKGKRQGWFERLAKTHPVTQAPFERVSDMNQGVVNDTIAATMDVPIKKFTASGVKQAKGILSNRYDDLVNRFGNEITLPDGMLDDLNPTIGGFLSRDEYRQLVEEMHSGQISGKTLKWLRTAISGKTTRESTQDRAIDAIKSLDKHVESVLPVELVDEWRGLRKQWRNYFVLEGITPSMSGDVDAQKYFNRIWKEYQGAVGKGATADAQEAADILREFISYSDPSAGGLIFEMATAPFAITGLAAQFNPSKAGQLLGGNLGRVAGGELHRQILGAPKVPVKDPMEYANILKAQGR